MARLWMAAACAVAVAVLGSQATYGAETTEDPVFPRAPVFEPSGAFALSKGKDYLGVVVDAEGRISGAVSLKVGSMNRRRGESKVKGKVALFDGRKYTVKATRVMTGATPQTVDLEVNKLGQMSVTIANDGFVAAFADGTRACTADLSSGLANAAAIFQLGAPLEVLNGKPVLARCLPTGEVVETRHGGWRLRKASKPRYHQLKLTKANGEATVTWTLDGLDDPAKPNLSSLRLRYAAKTGQFTGSFYIYTDVGTPDDPQLRKATAKVVGFVVDGVGVGQAKVTGADPIPVVIR